MFFFFNKSTTTHIPQAPQHYTGMASSAFRKVKIIIINKWTSWRDKEGIMNDFEEQKS